MSEKDRVDSSTNIHEQVSNLAKEFRKQISRGNSPRIERFLSQISPVGQENLLANLLEIELNYRHRRGDSPASAEYLKRFPRFATQVRRAFFEPTLGSVDSSTGSEDDDFTGTISSQERDGDPVAPTYELSDVNRLGEYELIRELGRGGMGIVYEARNSKSGNLVALKTLPNSGDGVNADKLYRFRKEFRRLSEINHPNLVGMQSLEVESDRWFFTMDLIDGEDFLSFVRPSEKLDEDRLRPCLRQLATGISELHRRRIIHRDLKPSNVLVSRQGRVTILDFGLAAQLQRAGDMTQSKSGLFAGTPPYAAPEQMFGERTEASDWYAFGTMLFESLVGERPFQDPDPMVLLRQKQEQDPPKLSERIEVPSDLAALTDGLLRREPRLRLTDTAVIEALGLEQETRTSGSTRDSQGSTGSVDAEDAELNELEEESIELIGRENQLAQLDDLRQAFLDDQQPSFTWVTGKSGEGKSSLVEKFLQPLRQSKELLVLSGRCYERESVPFKVIDALIESLARILRSYRPDDLNKWLPKDFHLLAHLFPAIRRIKPIDDACRLERTQLDDRQIRYRAFYALRDCLAAISSERPIIVFIDDLQWGDSDSAEVLFDYLSADHPLAIFLLGSYRSDEAEQSPFLQEWNKRLGRYEGQLNSHAVEVLPFTEEECVNFVAQSLGEDSTEVEEQARNTFASTKGNPYILEQLISGFDHETGKFESVPLLELINRKLKLLPDESRSLLQSIAIAGQAVSIEEVSQVSQFESLPLSTLNHMRSEKLIRLIRSDGEQLVDTYHDKIRESVLSSMKPDRRRELHLSFGEQIESMEGIETEQLLSYLQGDASISQSLPVHSMRFFDLAYHFHEASDPKGLTYQLIAGELYFRAFASDDAVELYRRILSELPDDTSVFVKYRVWERLATSLTRMGSFDEALSAYGNAKQFAPSAIASATALAGAAITHQSRGEFVKASENHDLALVEIGRARRKGWRAVVRFIPMAIRVFLLPERRNRVLDATQEAKESLEHRIYLHAVQTYYDLPSAIVNTFYGNLKVAGLSVVSSHSGRYSTGLSLFSGYLSLVGLSSLAKYTLKRSISATVDQDDLEIQGTNYAYFAVTLQVSLRLQESLEKYRLALPRLLSSGAHVVAAPCVHLCRHLLSSIGTATEERRCGEQVFELSDRIGDSRGMCWGRYDTASGLAREGKLQLAMMRIEQARKLLVPGERQLTEMIFLATEAFVRLQASDYEGARQACNTTLKYFRRRKVTMEFNLRALPWLIEALAGHNWNTKNNREREKPRKWLLRFSLAICLSFPIMKPHVLRVQGRFYWARGRKRKALRRLERAVRSAREMGAHFDLAKCLLDLAAVKEEGRDANRAEAIQLLKEMESVIPRAESWLLGDQYDEDVVAPEFDLAEWEAEHSSISTTSVEDKA